MWKILNKLTTELCDFKKTKGSTIVEVLVAVIIIGVVSVYGLSYFSSSYKYELNSKDYNLILENLVRQIEIAKGAVYQQGTTVGIGQYTTPLAHPRRYPGGIVDTGAVANPLHRNNFNFLSNNARVTLRRGCTVIYNYNEFENAVDLAGTANFFGSTRIVCEAQWPEEVAANRRNRITLVTYVAKRWV